MNGDIVTQSHPLEISQDTDFIQVVTEIMPAVVAVIALPSREIIYHNRDAMTLLGFDADNIQQMSFSDRASLFHPDDLPLIQDYYDRFSSLGDNEENYVEYRLRNKKDEWVFLSARGKVFKRDDSNNVTQILMVGQDITTRKKVEDDLDQNKELLQAVLNNTASSIMLLKPVRDRENVVVDFEYLFTNQQTLISMNRDLLVGKLFTEEFDGLKGSDLFHEYVRVIETGNNYQAEVDVEPFGAPVWVQVFARKMDDCLLVTYFDITERKKAEKEIKDQAQYLKAIAETNPDMISVINLQTNAIEFANATAFIRQGFGSVIEPFATRESSERRTAIYPDDRKAIENYFRSFRNTGDDDVQKVEYRAYNDNGELMSFIAQGRVFKKDEKGFPTHCVNIVHNITERKKAEKAIEEQAHFIQSITNAVPSIILIIRHPSGVIEFSNRDAFGLLGFDLKEMLNVGWEDRIQVYHQDDIQKLKDYYGRFDLLADDAENSLEYRVKNKKGEWVWMDVRGKVFERDEQGKVVRTLHTGRDITPRKKAEEEILNLKDEIAKSAEDKYRTLFNSMDEGYCIIQMIYDEKGQVCDWRFLDVNPAFERHNGLSNASGRTIRELAPTIESKWLNIYGKVAETGESIRFEEDSEAFHRVFDLYAFRIGAPDDHKVAVLFSDITGRKRSELALRESEQRLKELIRQKDDFIGIASHELKTPVTSIKSYAELVQERLEKVGDGNTALLHRLNEQIDRLTHLINNLLDTTKISEGGMSFNFGSVDLSAVLREKIDEIASLGKHRIVLQAENLPLVTADRERIGQVVTNLLSNAVKYSPDSTTVTVTAAATGNAVEVSVRDHGMGIPDADQKKVFDRFFRVTANQRDTYPGMGLGLYISAGIIRRHGGIIGVQSKPGEGAEFSFTIPY